VFAGRRQCAQAFPQVQGMPFWVSSTPAAICQLLCSWAESDLMAWLVAAEEHLHLTLPLPLRDKDDILSSR